MENNSNVVQKSWGYELTWAKKEEFTSKILAFSSIGSKTPFIFNADTDKSFFVNSGSFKLRWINTEDGQIYEQDLNEGQVWDADRLTPYSFQCLTDNSSITEVSNGKNSQDSIVIRTEMF